MPSQSDLTVHARHPCATVHPQRNPPCSLYQKQIQSGPQHVYTVPNPTSLLGCNWTSSGREGAWAIVMTRFMTKKLKLRTMLIQRQTNAHGPPSNRMLVHFCKQMISYSWQTYKKHGPTHACAIILLFANSQVTTKGRFYQMIYARTVKFSHFFFEPNPNQIIYQPHMVDSSMHVGNFNCKGFLGWQIGRIAFSNG
jgi:hypothetical protein